MAIFTQRINERSSISPLGFTGYIVRNSNIIIDKSYIEKGTSFINAFDNSNVLIKDCGTPIPSVESKITQYFKLKKKIENENEKALLPFWVHYNLGVTSNFNHAFLPGEAKLGYVHSEYFEEPLYITVNEYRNNLLAHAEKSNEIKDPKNILKDRWIVDSNYAIERQILVDEKISSDEVEYTLSGLFYLKNINSSIKAVFPLTNSISENGEIPVDDPNLILQFKNREFLPLTKGMNIKEKIFYKDVDKLDKFGSKVENYETLEFDNTDNYYKKIGYSMVGPVHKRIAETRSNNPEYETELYETINLLDSNHVSLTIENGSINNEDGTNNTSTSYIMGPYTRSTIAFKKFDDVEAIGMEQAENPLNFYFKYNGDTYNLFNYVNGLYSPNGSKYDETLYENYLKNNYEILNGQNILSLDIITKETNLYQPEGNYANEVCNFIGFKKTVVSYNGLIEGKFYSKFNDEYSDTTSSYLTKFLSSVFVTNDENNLKDYLHLASSNFSYDTHNSIVSFLPGRFSNINLSHGYDLTTEAGVMHAFYDAINYSISINPTNIEVKSKYLNNNPRYSKREDITLDNLSCSFIEYDAKNSFHYTRIYGSNWMRGAQTRNALLLSGDEYISVEIITGWSDYKGYYAGVPSKIFTLNENNNQYYVENDVQLHEAFNFMSAYCEINPVRNSPVPSIDQIITGYEIVQIDNNSIITANYSDVFINDTHDINTGYVSAIMKNWYDNMPTAMFHNKPVPKQYTIDQLGYAHYTWSDFTSGSQTIFWGENRGWKIVPLSGVFPLFWGYDTLYYKNLSAEILYSNFYNSKLLTSAAYDNQIISNEYLSCVLTGKYLQNLNSNQICGYYDDYSQDLSALINISDRYISSQLSSTNSELEIQASLLANKFAQENDFSIDNNSGPVPIENLNASQYIANYANPELCGYLSSILSAINIKHGIFNQNDQLTANAFYEYTIDLMNQRRNQEANGWATSSIQQVKEWLISATEEIENKFGENYSHAFLTPKKVRELSSEFYMMAWKQKHKLYREHYYDFNNHKMVHTLSGIETKCQHEFCIGIDTCLNRLKNVWAKDREFAESGCVGSGQVGVSGYNHWIDLLEHPSNIPKWGDDSSDKFDKTTGLFLINEDLYNELFSGAVYLLNPGKVNETRLITGVAIDALSSHTYQNVPDLVAFNNWLNYDNINFEVKERAIQHYYNDNDNNQVKFEFDNENNGITPASILYTDTGSLGNSFISFDDISYNKTSLLTCSLNNGIPSAYESNTISNDVNKQVQLEWYNSLNKTRSYKLVSGLTLADNGYNYIVSGCSSSDPESYLFVYPDDELTIHNVASNDISLLINEVTKDIVLDLNKNLKSPDALMLYFDSACINPIQIEKSTSLYNKCYIYDFMNGRKIYQDENNIGVINQNSNSYEPEYLYYNYKKLHKFKYKMNSQYEKEYAKDWYNANAYINYFNITNRYSSNYKLNLKKITVNTDNTLNIRDVNSSSSDFSSVSARFTSDYYYDDNIDLDKIRKHIGINSTYELCLSDNIPDNEKNAYRISSIFSKDEDYVKDEFTSSYLDNFSYKAFSFNFKIPKHGWANFNREMYKENPDYMKNILSPSTTGTIDIETTPLNEITTIAEDIQSISGEFSFLYGILDNRGIEQVVGNGLYGNDGDYVDVNGEHHIGAMIDPNNVVKSGSSDISLSSSYNVVKVKIPFYGKIKNDILYVASPNETFSFVADFRTDTTQNVIINGIFTTVEINSIIHNIIIPTLKLEVKATSESENLSGIYIRAFNSGKINKKNSWDKDSPYSLDKMMCLMYNSDSEQISSLFHANDWNWTEWSDSLPKPISAEIVFPKCYTKSPQMNEDKEFVKSTDISNDQGKLQTGKPKFNSSDDKLRTNFITSSLIAAIYYEETNLISGKFWRFDNRKKEIVVYHPSTEWKKEFDFEGIDLNELAVTSEILDLPILTGDCSQWWRYLLGNMAPIEQQDENGFPYVYLPLYSMKFTNNISNERVISTNFNWFGNENDDSIKSYIGNLLSNNNSWNDVPSNLASENIANKVPKINSTAGALPLDAEPLVIPFDMSTNLMYYKASEDSEESSSDNNEILSGDEVIIINARKMYSEPHDIDTMPVGGKVALDLSQLTDTTIKLSAIIPGNEDEISKFLNEVNVYVEPGLTYTTNPSNVNGKHKCRYVEVEGRGSQCKLYEINKNIVFSTYDDTFKIPLVTSQSLSGNHANDEVIYVPAKLSLTLSGLIFQQRCREGLTFDDITDITFSQRVLSGSVFGLNGDFYNGDNGHYSSYSNILERYGLANLGITQNQLPNCFTTDEKQTIDIPSAFINGHLKSHDEDLGNYYVIKINELDSKRMLSSEYSFGGSNYYSDIYEMKRVTNSANKWKTYNLDTQFSKMYAYSDYNPGSSIIGTPYLNQLGKIVVQDIPVTVQAGTNSMAKQFLASVVKTATDIEYVNSTLNIDDNIKEYKNSDFRVNVTTTSLSEKSSIASTYIYAVSINGSIGDYESNIEITGLKYFNLGLPSKIGVYFDGFEGRKDIIFEKDTDLIDTIQLDGIKYYIIGLNKSTIRLYNHNNEGMFYGTIYLQLTKNCPSQTNNYVELHNFKLPAPVITSIGVSFSNTQKSELDYDGYYSLTNDIWQKQVTFNNINGSLYPIVNIFDIDNTGDGNITYGDYRIYSSTWPNEGLSGNSTLLVNKDGEVTGLLLTLQIPGIKMFDHAGMQFSLENKKEVKLETSEMVNDYKSKMVWSNSTDLPVELRGKAIIPSEYDLNAMIGSIVTSGNITALYNVVTTKPMQGRAFVGHLRYKYNPIDDDKFQLEVITKSKGSNFKKTLYFVNKEVDKWYNLAIYKTIVSDKENNISVSLHFLLNDVDDENINNIDSKPQEIFRCFVSNDSHLKGRVIDCNLNLGNDMSNWKETLFPKDNEGKILSFMENWKSLYDIKFNKCMRVFWNYKYTNDSKFLAYSKTNLEKEFDKRREFDLYKISDSFNSLYFKNISGTIKLFANTEVEYLLGKNLSTSNISEKNENVCFYDLFIKNGFDSNTSDNYDLSNSSKWNENYDLQHYNQISIGLSSLIERLLIYEPRRILLDDSSDNYILRKKTDDQIKPKIKSCEIMAKNVMIISSPNLSYKVANNLLNEKEDAYAESYNESLGAVNDYEEFFGNPQHRLPPVNYKNRILDSDYATFIYNNAYKYDAVKIYTDASDLSSLISYDYSKNPNIISYTWGNSQVTRSETDGTDEYISKLYWNKAVFGEYVSEVGSIYNYTDAQHITNAATIEAGSINERQCILLPTISNPFKYEARTGNEGIVKVVDNIVATAALGYTKLGYPKNGILSYNENGNVYINSSLRNYIYIEQNGASSSCNIGSTTQKPVFVESVTIHNQSLHETFKFLPNPEISIKEKKLFIDISDLEIQGGNVDYNYAETKDLVLFYIGSVKETTFDYQNTTSLSETGKQAAYKDEVYFSDIPYYSYTLSRVKDLKENIYKVLYMINDKALPSATELSNGSKYLNKTGINVFYNEEEINVLRSELAGDNGRDLLNTSLKTQEAFNYEGKLSVNDPKILQNMDYTSSEGQMSVPTFAVIWANINVMPSKNIYNNDVLNTTIAYSNRYALVNEYLGANISAIRFKINVEDLNHAPTYIQIALLKYDSSKGDFYWLYDSSLNFDKRESYDEFYDENASDSIYIEHIFKDDDRHLTKNVYGVKFSIIEIVPNKYNALNHCKIGNIQILASNYLNKYGLAQTVEDVYVRKIDSNYNSNYPVKCSEYIWRLPNNESEWSKVNNIISTANEFTKSDVIYNAANAIEKYINRINSPSLLEETQANDYLTLSVDAGLQSVISYFISNRKNQNNEISEILSDNYLVDSSIQISWKYVDYVYIYYSCYSTNAKDLLDYYFGDKIYNAVRIKLINNINNLNANSAFNNKFRFSGGIAVQKENALNTITNNTVFEWKADVRTDQLTKYQDVYETETTTTKTKQATQTLVQKDIYNKDKQEVTKTTLNVKTGKPFTTTETINEVRVAESNILDYKENTVYLGTTLQNVKYSSVDNWTRSFSPRQIKYKIN